LWFFAIVCVSMERYSKQQQVLIVKIHYQNGEHYVVTVRKLHTILGHHNAPNESTIRRLIRKFEESGSTQNNKISGCPRSGRSDANVVVVHDFVTKSPRKLCRHRLQFITMQSSLISCGLVWIKWTSRMYDSNKTA